MVLCKFFLQGTCRFGENCKFEHQLGDNRQQHASIIRQQNFTTNPNNTSIDINTLVRAVTNDMLMAEKGGQWLLSCYAPFKEKPNFPGFEEQSFEEVRWGHYEARLRGSVDQYNQQLQMALQTAAMRIRSLQNPTPDAINTIKTIYNTTPKAASVFGNSNFNSTPGNPFASSGNNMFAQNNQQASPAKSIFAAANQQLFANTQPQSNSIFANNQSSIFANQNPVFAAQNQNPFGIPANQNSPFAQPQQPFAQQPFAQQPVQDAAFNALQQNPSPFGMPTQLQTNSPLFNPQQNAPPYGQQNQNPAFNMNQPFASPFNTQPNTNSPFAMQAPPQPFHSSSSNTMFGNTNSAQTVYQASSTSLVSGADENMYSKLEDLSESDIKAYESDNFEFGKIPEKPPTFQMCF